MARISDLTVNGDTHLLGKTYGTLSGNVNGNVNGRATNADLADEVKTTSTISGDKLPVLFKKYSDNKLYYQPEEELWYSPNSFVLHSHYFDGDLKGRADVATKADRLSTARTIALTGKASGSSSFDGSGNININVSNVNADSINGNIVLKYEQKEGETRKTLHGYVDGVEVPLAAPSPKRFEDDFIDLMGKLNGTIERSGIIVAGGSNKPNNLEIYINNKLVGFVTSRGYGTGVISTSVPVNRGDSYSIRGYVKFAYIRYFQ